MRYNGVTVYSHNRYDSIRLDHKNIKLFRVSGEFNSSDGRVVRGPPRKL